MKKQLNKAVQLWGWGLKFDASKASIKRE